MRTLAALALVAGLALPATALAGSAEHSPRLLALLRSPDGAASGPALRHLLPGDSEGALHRAAMDSRLPLAQRRRALGFLPLLGSARARALLEATAAAEVPTPLRWTAVYSRIAGWAGREPHAALGWATRWLLHPTPLLREAAVRGIGGLALPEARQALIAHERRERDPVVRAALARALRR